MIGAVPAPGPEGRAGLMGEIGWTPPTGPADGEPLCNGRIALLAPREVTGAALGDGAPGVGTGPPVKGRTADGAEPKGVTPAAGAPATGAAVGADGAPSARTPGGPAGEALDGAVGIALGVTLDCDTAGADGIAAVAATGATEGAIAGLAAWTLAGARAAGFTAAALAGRAVLDTAGGTGAPVTEVLTAGAAAHCGLEA